MTTMPDILSPCDAAEIVAANCGTASLEAWEQLRKAVREKSLFAYVLDAQEKIHRVDPLQFFLYSKNVPPGAFAYWALKPFVVENGQKIKGQLFFFGHEIEATFRARVQKRPTKVEAIVNFLGSVLKALQNL
jgi:hypothetical protein